MARPITCKTCKFQFSLLYIDKIKWNKNYMRCPDCGVLYCCLPKTESKLRQLQDIWVINRSEYIFNMMYKILIDYAKSLILKDYSSFIKTPEELDYYAINAVSLLYKDLLRDEDNPVIRISFAGFLIRKIRQAILGKEEKFVGDIHRKKKNIDEDWSVDNIKNKLKVSNLDWEEEKAVTKERILSQSINYNFDDGNEVEYKDDNCLLSEFIERENKKVYKKQIEELLFEIDKYCDSQEENVLRLSSLFIYIKKGEIWTDKFWKLFGKKAKYKFEQSLEILRGTLKKYYENSS